MPLEVYELAGELHWSGALELGSKLSVEKKSDSEYMAMNDLN